MACLPSESGTRGEGIVGSSLASSASRLHHKVKEGQFGLEFQAIRDGSTYVHSFFELIRDGVKFLHRLAVTWFPVYFAQPITKIFVQFQRRAEQLEEMTLDGSKTCGCLQRIDNIKVLDRQIRVPWSGAGREYCRIIKIPFGTHNPVTPGRVQTLLNIFVIKDITVCKDWN